MQALLNKNRLILIQFTNAAWVYLVESHDSPSTELKVYVLDICKIVESSNISFSSIQTDEAVLKNFRILAFWAML